MNKHIVQQIDIDCAIHKVESCSNKRDFCNYDVIQYEVQKKALRSEISKAITEKYNHNNFLVYDNEAGFGKTRIALDSLPYFFKNNIDSRILWVAEEDEQCDKYADYINELFNKQIAITVTTKNGRMTEKQRKKSLQEYTVVFITHEKYKLLSLDREEIEWYKENRDLLIIDEYVDCSKDIISFSYDSYAILKQNIEKKYGKKSMFPEYLESITHPLCTCLDNYKHPKLIKLNKNVEKIIDNIYKGANFYVDVDIYTRQRQIVRYTEKEVIRNFYGLIQLENFYKGYFLIEKDKETKKPTLKVPNYNMEVWGLKRNIILDASASLCYEYILNPQNYKVKTQEKIFSYDKWKLVWGNVNTTTSGKDKYENYYEEVNDLISELNPIDTLVVTKLYNDEEKTNEKNKKSKIRKKNIFIGNVTHWGDFKGKNEYGDLKNLVIEDSNLLWSSEYILKYLYYARNQDSLITDITYIRRKNEFKEPILQDILQKTIANNYYQAVKRVNRNMKYESKIYILCSNHFVVDMVASMLPYCQYEILDTSNIFKKEKIEKKPKSKKNINAFLDLCNQLLESDTIPQNMINIINNNEKYMKNNDIINGKIPKHIFQECLMIKNDKSFSKNVMNNEDVKKYLTKNKIIIERTNLIFPKKFNI